VRQITSDRMPRQTRARVTTAVVAGLLVATAAGASAALSPAPAATAPDAASMAAPSTAGPARLAATANPLTGHRWGVYKGNADQAWKPYVSSSGANRQLLAKIALRPKAKWFGRWISNDMIRTKVRQYIENSTGGDPDVLVQMTVFRMVPWEHEACRRLPTAAEQAGYKQWIDRFASGIGNTHVALILQPDGPFALCAPHGSTLPSRLVAYASRRFSALPHTSVYIDSGASDWPAHRTDEAVKILLRAGVRYARGFAMNSTHYSATSSNITYGATVVRQLARRGVPGKHFVINTSSNGRPFTFNKARGSHPDNAKVCATRTERVCVTLGIPPTADVASTRWGLSATNRMLARTYVDGYLWFGRPWLFMQANPFDTKRALALARTTPY
jgi:endoglucanase